LKAAYFSFVGSLPLWFKVSMTSSVALFTLMLNDLQAKSHHQKSQTLICGELYRSFADCFEVDFSVIKGAAFGKSDRFINSYFQVFSYPPP